MRHHEKSTWDKWRLFTTLILEIPSSSPGEHLARLSRAWLVLSGHGASCQCHPCATARAIERIFNRDEE